MDKITQEWVDAFKAVIDLEVSLSPKKKNADAYRAVEAKTGIDYDYLYQIHTGRKLPTKDVMAELEKHYPEQCKKKIALSARQDLSMALFNGYISLVKVLTQSGALDVAALANEIGNTLDFRRTQGIETAEQNQMLETLYRAVLQIEKHQSDIAALKADFERRLQELGKPPGIDD